MLVHDQETAQCFGLPPASPGNHRSDGNQAGHALTFKLDHSRGADHNDTIDINAATDISDGIELSGGAGTDILLVHSTDISTLTFPVNDTDIATTETFDLRGGSATGVSVTIEAAKLDSFTTIIGDGTADTLNLSTNNINLDGKTLTDIEIINLTSGQQQITIKTGTTLSG